MRLVDWLDDLCVRFIINLPHEELQSVERICFQIEEAQWFYEDFIRPLDPSLPSMNLRKFAMLMFQHCPLSSAYSELHHSQAYEDFLAYKTRVPVRGAIMLNQDMTQAVLVKGWKKGAKWSFPRGKINKGEADLDCAVREVYEETGFDLKQHEGLVGTEADTKSITVAMREQHMKLYVFRGVPMDAHFEPRTRKEISKIAWYKLGDLPTLKRKNQAQQGNGADLLKDNMFYMVAPFLGPLKGWIKLQHKLDKQRAKAGATLAPPVPAGETDLEEAEVNDNAQGETTADEATIAQPETADTTFADLVAQLGRGHRSSDALPEVSAQPQPPQILDPAAELKRLLSVGAAALPLQTPPVEAPAPVQDQQSHPLLAMIQRSKPTGLPPPRTPLDQIMSPPPVPHSPHGQHHPRPTPPHPDHMPPPPAFQFPLQQNLPYRGPQPPHVPPHMPPQHPNAPPMQIPRQFMPPPPRHPNPVFQAHAPNIQQAFSQQAPRPYQRTGDPQFAQSPQFPGLHGPAIPPASKLPPPKLTAHALGLLNAFKSHEKPTPPTPQHPSHPAPSSQATPRMQQLPALHPTVDPFSSPRAPPSANLYAPSPPPFRSPPPSANFQPAQPKPRSAHQDNLLNLFRSPSVSAATPPPPKIEAQPVELSAHPTPGVIRLQPASHDAAPPRPDLTIKPNLLEAFGQRPRKPSLTSATISGPLNAPDFETVKKSSLLHDINGHGHHGHGHERGISPGGRKSVEQKTFIPMQILKREHPIPSNKPSPTEVAEDRARISPRTISNETTPQTTAFKPQILRRPQQNASPVPASALGPAPLLHAGIGVGGSYVAPPIAPAALTRFPAAPGAHGAFDRRETLPSEQKSALLSLFGKPSQVKSPSPSPLPVVGPAHEPPPASTSLPTLPSKSPFPRSPQPPTPKTMMSGVISPVSPLPEKGSQQNSPANLASRSRISSIGETMPPTIVIPQNGPGPTSHPSTSVSQKNGFGSAGVGVCVEREEGYISAESVGAGLVDKGKGKKDEGKSPVDKTFLLGFLEDVARRGR
ncbi:uncharacterized protein BDR25DRAFT_326456 [Lindgomyces ingoldianus]|uniref:Uncharacterized protein n=1 Tax=Lindgomyces ingoldianus TaxID=673940 RepID=A0ACB6QNZ9_9PLEO|nr:uncharacterized protein BDR25DRAFT_326456 [Lindgomyces ingoldianus]KAF2468714.1 hypothetical protein BDR25DRAFT_326456 [Lindgomyces ingoldianus]